MKKVVFLVLWMVCTNSFATTWTKSFQVDYVLGDGDSKSTARELAIEQIKIKASNEAGTYIQTTSTLKNDSLEESIQVISASMIKLTHIKEKLTTKNNTITLTISANANINEEKLKDRIKAIQGDKAKAKQITKLKKDNDLLLVELNTVKTLLAQKNVNTQQVSAILKRQTNLINRFKNNASAVSRVFSKGTLLQMAKKSSGKIEQIKAQLETEFFGPMMETKVNAEITDVIESGNGYTALVNVSWKMPSTLSYKTLSTHLSTYEFDKRRNKPIQVEDLSIRDSSNTGTDAKTSLTELLFSYLGRQSVNIQINLGSNRFSIPLVWSRPSGSFSACSSGKGKFSLDSGQICFRATQKKNEDLSGVGYKNDANPIKFHLTRSEAENITTIEAKVTRS
jgi:hypothetical protein